MHSLNEECSRDTEITKVYDKNNEKVFMDNFKKVLTEKSHTLFELEFNNGDKKAVEVSTRPFKLFNRLQIAREFQKHHFGMPIFKPEFFIPMVVHRMLKAVKISRILEFAGKALGMTYLFGSPVIVKTTRFYV